MVKISGLMAVFREFLTCYPLCFWVFFLTLLLEGAVAALIGTCIAHFGAACLRNNPEWLK